MKNFLKILLIVFTFSLTACQEEKAVHPLQEISGNEVYFFYQKTCPHCHHAAQYINTKYPGLKMINLDVQNRNNYNLFLKCVEKFKIDQSTLGTPLICMGNHYIMGWSEADSKRFDAYVQRFK